MIIFLAIPLLPDWGANMPDLVNAYTPYLAELYSSDTVRSKKAALDGML